MRRREFITLLGGTAVAWPLRAHAQQPGGMRRIGVLMTYDESDPEGQSLAAWTLEADRALPVRAGLRLDMQNSSQWPRRNFVYGLFGFSFYEMLQPRHIANVGRIFFTLMLPAAAQESVDDHPCVEQIG